MKPELSGRAAWTWLCCTAFIKSSIPHTVHEQRNTTAPENSSIKRACSSQNLDTNTAAQGFKRPFLPDHLKYLWFRSGSISETKHTHFLSVSPLTVTTYHLVNRNSGERNCVIRLQHNQVFDLVSTSENSGCSEFGNPSKIQSGQKCEKQQQWSDNLTSLLLAGPKTNSWGQSSENLPLSRPGTALEFT